MCLSAPDAENGTGVQCRIGSTGVVMGQTSTTLAVKRQMSLCSDCGWLCIACVAAPGLAQQRTATKLSLHA